jgi:FixJ family two-component response regulator
MTVQAMKAGAVEFLTKPSRDQELLDAIQQAIAHHREVRRQRAELGTSEITVKIHRGQVMHKMRAASVAELVRMAARVGLPAPRYEPPYTNV